MPQTVFTQVTVHILEPGYVCIAVLLVDVSKSALPLFWEYSLEPCVNTARVEPGSVLYSHMHVNIHITTLEPLFLGIHSC